jgi:hypothetical protein
MHAWMGEGFCKILLALWATWFFFFFFFGCFRYTILTFRSSSYILSNSQIFLCKTINGTLILWIVFNFTSDQHRMKYNEGQPGAQSIVSSGSKILFIHGIYFRASNVRGSNNYIPVCCECIDVWWVFFLLLFVLFGLEVHIAVNIWTLLVCSIVCLVWFRIQIVVNILVFVLLGVDVHIVVGVFVFFFYCLFCLS